MNYEERIVAFIDILGFKNLVETGTCDKVAKAIDILNDFTADSVRVPSGESLIKTTKSRFVTQFSDSVVLSVKVTESSSVFNTLLDLQYTVAQLLHYGYLCRGGICIGNVVHNEKYLFGPAMNQAYFMENKQAQTPRIIIDENLLFTGGIFRASHHTPQQERDFIEDIITKDSDGIYYIDYFGKVFSELLNPSHATEYLQYIVNAISKIDLDISKAKDNPILENSLKLKSIWMKEKYNSLISNLKNETFFTCFFDNGNTKDPNFVKHISNLKLL